MKRCDSKHPHRILKPQPQNQKFVSALPHLFVIVPQLHLPTTVGDHLAKARPQVMIPILLLFPPTVKRGNHLFLNRLENLEDQKVEGTTLSVHLVSKRFIISK